MKISHRNCKSIMWALFALGVVCCLLTTYGKAWVIPAVILFAAAVAVNFIFWRCPHCKSRLNAKTTRTESCPCCGRSLF